MYPIGLGWHQAGDYHSRTSEDTFKPVYNEFDEQQVTDIWWTRSCFLTSVGNFPCADGSTINNPLYFEWPRSEGGSHSTFTVDGQCLDADNLPIQYISVCICHSTSDGVFRGTCVTDMAGNYHCPTDVWGVAHYVDSYCVRGGGLTDLAGTSRKDILPT